MRHNSLHLASTLRGVNGRGLFWEAPQKNCAVHYYAAIARSHYGPIASPSPVGRSR